MLTSEQAVLGQDKENDSLSFWEGHCKKIIKIHVKIELGVIFSSYVLQNFVNFL